MDIGQQPSAPQGPQQTTSGMPGMDFSGSPQSASPQIPQSSPQDNPTLQPPNAPNTGGWLKQALQRFAYHGSQAALKHVNLPTDDELQMHQAQVQDIQAQIEQRKAQTAQLGQMVTLPNGVTLPYGIAKTAYPAYFRGEAQQGVANTNAGAKITVAGMNNDTKKDINQATLDSQETRTADTLANRLKVAALQGNYSLRRAAISASAGGGSSAADYLPAVNAGMPINQVPSKIRGEVLRLAQASGGKVSFQKMSVGGQKMVDSIAELQPVLADARDALESHKTENDLGAYAKGLTEGAKYKLGIATDDPLYQKINKVGNLVKVLGATPYTTVGRGKYLFDEIQKHLPRPGLDTPQLMYEKINTLDGLLQQMDKAVQEQQFKGVTGMGGDSNTPPPGANVIDYTQLGKKR
jgi:hypothetical protein